MLCPALSFTVLSMQFLSYLELLGASSQVDSGSLEFALSIKNKGFPFEFIYLTILELLSTPEVIPRDRKNSKSHQHPKDVQGHQDQHCWEHCIL